MDISQHRTRHEILHGYLDELLADFIRYGNGRPSNSILDLLKWSNAQLTIPNHPATDEDEGKI